MITPLTGWTDFEWSGLVLRGRDPQGRAWSIGEILRDGGGWVLEIADNTDGNAWSRTRAATKRAARAAAPIAVRALGGAWDDAEHGERSLIERCLRYVADHPGATGPQIGDALGVPYAAVRSALSRAQTSGVLRSGGRGTKSGWVLGAEPSMPSDMTRIIEYLRAHPAATRAAIAKALDIDAERITRLLRRAEWRGRVERGLVRGHTVWSVTPATPAPVAPAEPLRPPAPPRAEPSDSEVMSAARALWRAWTQFVAVVDAAGGIDG